MAVIPSEEQQRIADSTDQVVMIEAVAGAGKTTTLALIAKRLPPARVMGLCFSAGARKRFQQKLVEEGAAKGVAVHTLEEFARAQLALLVKAGFLDAPRYYASDEDVRPHLVEAADAVWQRHERRGGSDFDFSFEHNSSRVDELLQLMYKLKATLTTLRFEDEDFGDDDFAYIAEQFDVPAEAVEICKAYERQRQPELGFFRWHTAADFVVDLLAVLRARPEALAALPQHGLYIVDEWHDVNAAEFELLQLMRRKARLVVVGDRDQIINSARGADTRFSSTGFDIAFPQAKRLSLSKSHRFGAAVSKLAQRTTGHKCSSHPERLTVLRNVMYAPSEANSCALRVVEQVQQLLGERADTRHADIAIVVREADQSVEIENMLLDRNVPYVCDGLDSYLHRPEILMLRGLLHIASGHYAPLRGDKDSCERMVLGLALYVSPSHAEQHWEMDYHDSGAKKGEDSWMAQAQKTVADEPAALESFFSGILCKAHEFDNEATVRWKQRFSQLVQTMRERGASAGAAELMRYASGAMDLVAATSRAFVSRSRADSAIRTIAAFIAFAEQHGTLPAAAFLDQLAERQRKVSKNWTYLRTRSQLTLTTIQAAKGQEWPYVLLPYLERGQFPRLPDMEEEKRYFYVAMTRAIHGLTFFEPDEEHAAARSELVNRLRKPSPAKAAD